MNGKFATSDFLYLTRRSLLQRSAAAGIGAGLVLGLLPGETSAQSPKRGGKLIVGVKGGSTSDPLDPVLMPSQAAAFVTYQYANWLVTRTPSGELKGELTESWESSGDGKRWAFKLKQGIKFHNGKEFTSADVIYSLDRHRAPGSKSPIANLMKGIDNVKADGPYQFSIVLKEPDAGLPYLLTQIYLVMQPKDESPDRGIGTGPYVLEKAEPGKRFTFRRNTDYFDPDSVWFEELEILIINDDTARISALLSGSAHLITEIPPNLVTRLKTASSLNIVSTPETKLYYFVMQIDKPPFDNPDLRLALKYSVDRDMILKGIAAGYGEIGNDHPLNSVYPLHPKDISQHSYDVEKARYHYNKSGHSGPIVLHVAEIFPGAVDMSVMFQQSAAKAGITIELKREPVDGWWDNVYLKAPFQVSYWGSLTTEDHALSLPYASDASWNDSHFRRPEFDKLLAQARAQLDPKLREDLYKQAATMIHDDGGHIVVMFPHNIEGMSSKLQGYVQDPFGGAAKATQRCWFAS